MLIASNHSWVDIQSYTLNQVGVFVREAVKEQENKRRSAIYAAWIGTNADKKSVERILKPVNSGQNDQKKVKADVLRLAQRLKGLK